jgi:hypothetical protein
LDISNKGLEGSLDLSDFFNVKKLNFSFNQLTFVLWSGSNNSLEEIDESHNLRGPGVN